MVTQTTTPSTAKDTGPLDWRIAITDSGGRPTPEFQRRWNSQRNNNGLIGTTIGNGPPSDTPQTDGLSYADSSTDPFTFYVSYNGAWHQVSAMTFLQLLDTPSDYTGAADELVKVNGTEDGLEFITISDTIDLLGNVEGDVLYRGASGWTVLPPGTAGQILSTAGPSADPLWIDPPSGAVAFTDLTDVPHTYIGQAGKLVRVNMTPDGLEFITLSAELDVLGATQGDILYRNGTVWTALTPGTSGQALITGGAAANPAWGAAGNTAYFGVGAPSTLHNEGDTFYDVAHVPYPVYIQHSGVWIKVGQVPCNALLFAEGLLAANELLGEWSFVNTCIIDQNTGSSFYTSGLAATASCDLPLQADIGAGWVPVGSLHMGAGLKSGSLVITSNPLILPSKSRLRCLAPASPDATLADVYAQIMGT